MTAFKSQIKTSPEKVPHIDHPCLRRISDRRYELVGFGVPQRSLTFDIEQIREIVNMDHHLREGRDIKSIPAGYLEVATAFNHHAIGRERFATYNVTNNNLTVCTDGNPVTWEMFLVKEERGGTDSGKVREGSSRRTLRDLDNEPTSKSDDLPLHALVSHVELCLMTTEELISFWVERGAIEHEYASRLAKLAERIMGEGESRNLRSAIDSLRFQAAKQAMAHNTLANQIAIDLESRCLQLQISQKCFFQDVFQPRIKKLQEDPVEIDSPHQGISSEWKKEYKNIRRFLENRRFNSLVKDPKRHSISSSDNVTLNMQGSSSRGRDWEELRKSCQEFEAERSRLVRDVLSGYTDALSSIQKTHDDSYKVMVQASDLFEPKEVLKAFSEAFEERLSTPPVVNLRHSIDQQPSDRGEAKIHFSRTASTKQLPTFGPRERPKSGLLAQSSVKTSGHQRGPSLDSVAVVSEGQTGLGNSSHARRPLPNVNQNTTPLLPTRVILPEGMEKDDREPNRTPSSSTNTSRRRPQSTLITSNSVLVSSTSSTLRRSNTSRQPQSSQLPITSETPPNPQGPMKGFRFVSADDISWKGGILNSDIETSVQPIRKFKFG